MWKKLKIGLGVASGLWFLWFAPLTLQNKKEHLKDVKDGTKDIWGWWSELTNSTVEGKSSEAKPIKLREDDHSHSKSPRHEEPAPSQYWNGKGTPPPGFGLGGAPKSIAHQPEKVKSAPARRLSMSESDVEARADLEREPIPDTVNKLVKWVWYSDSRNAANIYAQHPRTAAAEIADAEKSLNWTLDNISFPKLQDCINHMARNPTQNSIFVSAVPKCKNLLAAKRDQMRGYKIGEVTPESQAQQLHAVINQVAQEPSWQKHASEQAGAVLDTKVKGVAS